MNDSQLLLKDDYYYGPKYRCTTYINFFQAYYGACGHKTALQKNKWTVSIKTLTQQLFQLGLVIKRLKGELFARLIMILTRNQIRLGPFSQDVIQIFGKSGKA